MSRNVTGGVCTPPAPSDRRAATVAATPAQRAIRDLSVDLASILRGDPARADDLRAALDGLTREGYVLVPRAELVDIAAARPDDGTIAHRVIIAARLLDDPVLLAWGLTDILWHEREQAAA